jgi:hypothetical protein
MGEAHVTPRHGPVYAARSMHHIARREHHSSCRMQERFLPATGFVCSGSSAIRVLPLTPADTGTVTDETGEVGGDSPRHRTHARRRRCINTPPRSEVAAVQPLMPGGSSLSLQHLPAEAPHGAEAVGGSGMGGSRVVFAGESVRPSILVGEDPRAVGQLHELEIVAWIFGIVARRAIPDLQMEHRGARSVCKLVGDTVAGLEPAAVSRAKLELLFAQHQSGRAGDDVARGGPAPPAVRSTLVRPPSSI